MSEWSSGKLFGMLCRLVWFKSRWSLFRNKHEATGDMLFSQRKYTIINKRTQTCNETYSLFEKNEKTLRSKKSLIRYPSLIWHSWVKCHAPFLNHSLLSYTSISHCTAHKCLASFSFPDIWHSTVKCLFPIHDNELRCLQRESNSPDTKPHPLCYESPRYPARHRVNRRKQQNLIKFKCAIYFRDKLIRLKKPFTCPICQAYKKQQLSRTSNTYYGIVAASRHRLVQDTN